MARSLAPSSLLLFLIWPAGCNQQSEAVPGSETGPQVSVSIPAESSGSVAPLGGAAPSTSESPTHVVQSFLVALRGGDDQTTAALLTDKAREETAKHNLVVQPPGTPSARFVIGDVEYIDSKQSGAHVNSVWTEGHGTDDAVSYEIVWAVRQQHDGWRIAGMATEIIDGQPPVFLNFEDPTDMLDKWHHAEEIAARHEETIRQAQSSAETLAR